MFLNNPLRVGLILCSCPNVHDQQVPIHPFSTLWCIRGGHEKPGKVSRTYIIHSFLASCVVWFVLLNASSHLRLDFVCNKVPTETGVQPMTGPLNVSACWSAGRLIDSATNSSNINTLSTYIAPNPGIPIADTIRSTVKVIRTDIEMTECVYVEHSSHQYFVQSSIFTGHETAPLKGWSVTSIQN